MPVYMLEQMPADELRKWGLYFEARPIGWREDNRTSMLLRAQGMEDSNKLFPTLEALRKYEETKPDEEVMQSTLKRSVFGALLSSANSKKD